MENENLTVLNYANGFTLWHYNAGTKPVDEIRDDPRFFGTLWTLCACGDLMYITSGGKTEMVQIVKIDKNYVQVR